MLDNALPAQNAARLQPVQPSERIVALDILRGFALFGVLLAYALWSLGSPPEEMYSPFDRMLNFLLAAVVDTKFYTLFAVLFGLGFSIQLTRASARGASVVPVYCRRLLALVAIGLAHALLLRNGDILVPYAVMGFFLLLFRNGSNRMLVVGAIIGLIVPYLARGAWELAGLSFPQRPETHGMSYLAGNYAWVRYWYSIAITFWPESLPMFLFGLYLGRRGFFENVAAHRRMLRRVVIVAPVIGVIAFACLVLLNMAWANQTRSFAQLLGLRLLWKVHAWGLAACYASTLLLVLQNASWQRRLAPIGAVGRMALTNYLLQASLLVPVCILFGLFERVTPVIAVVLALGVWALQVPASVLWLRRFRFGPAEWVWRSLTYGRRQPMRTASEAAVAVGA